MLGLHRRQRRTCRGKPGLGGIALLRRRRPVLVGLDPPRFRFAQGIGGGRCLGFCGPLRLDLLASVAERRELLGKLGSFLLRPRELRPRSLERRFADAAFGTHRSLSREQFGKRRLGFTRSCLRGNQLLPNPRRLRFRILEPLLDRSTLLLQLLDRA